jgi:5-oxoprolinase (ATP-hydrolysing)
MNPHLEQVAANTKGIALVGELIREHGLPTVQAYMAFIQSNAEAAVRDMLRDFSLRQVGTVVCGAADYILSA